MSVAQGNKGTSTITTAATGTFNNSIALSATGAPAGTSISFSPGTIAAPGSGNSTMTFTVGATTPLGTYPITVSGNGGGIQKSVTVTLSVTVPPNFTITASPASVSIQQGYQGTPTVTTTISGGFNSAIALSASGMPSGTTVAFSPSAIPAPGNGNSALTITVSTNTPLGTYPITVSGNGGGIQQNVTVSLTVTSQPPNFTISGSPLAVALQQGNQGSAAFITTISGGFNSDVNLSVTGVPNGTTVSLTPQTISAPGAGSSMMTIVAGSTTVTGAYPITVTAAGGGVQRAVTMTLTVTTAASAGAPFPTPPQVYIDTTWNSPVGGTTWNVGCTGSPTNDGKNVQTAINGASPGDIIVLQAGCTYSGNLVLPPKDPTSGNWIYIESSALATLPAPGTRVGPGDAANMPKITTPNTSPAIIAECVSLTGGTGGNNCQPGTPQYPVGANHFRLVDLEITSTSNLGCNLTNNPPIACWSYYIFQAESPNNGDNGSVTPLADSITIDRCYIHGTTNGANSQDVTHAVGANITNFAIVESYVSDIHGSTSDSQAVLAYYTPGPIKIVNNYLSATTEDVMFGGAGGYNNPYVPSDIEIRRNHFFKPRAWESCGAGGTVAAGGTLADGSKCPSGLNNQWVEKNSLEFKSGRRVIVSGNVMENTWLSGQTGSSLLVTVRTSQSGNIAVVDDIIVQSNVFTNVDAGINTLEQDNYCGAANGFPNCTNPGEARRVWVNNNLLLLSPNPDTSQHPGMKLGGGSSADIGATDFILQHNTVLMSDQSTTWASMYFELPAMPWGCAPPSGFSSTHNIWILDNALPRQPNGDCGLVSLYGGTTGLAYYMGDPTSMTPRYFGNVMFVPSGDSVKTWPGTSNDATTAPFTYVDPGHGNYQLLTPDWLTTTDGNVSGIDWNTVQQAMNP